MQRGLRVLTLQGAFNREKFNIAIAILKKLMI